MSWLPWSPIHSSPSHGIRRSLALDTSARPIVIAGLRKCAACPTLLQGCRLHIFAATTRTRRRKEAEVAERCGTVIHSARGRLAASVIPMQRVSFLRLMIHGAAVIAIPRQCHPQVTAWAKPSCKVRMHDIVEADCRYDVASRLTQRAHCARHDVTEPVAAASTGSFAESDKSKPRRLQSARVYLAAGASWHGPNCASVAALPSQGMLR